MNQSEPAHRLARETSPYLKQHADNPVDWYPWGPEALEKAKAENKPILLSVGYSACHWCHVMAHESFEDEATARVMNALFVNIKVDREERPDIDRIYQTAHQLLTQRPGGWPLTMFLTPEGQMPFFGGTYFPPMPRHGMPAFTDLLERVAVFYRENADEIREQGDAMRDAFAQMNPSARTAGALNESPLDGGRKILASGFDPDHGGFGPAPKFPNAGGIDLMMRRWCATAHQAAPDTEALFMAAHTLRRMALGGLFDQVGGGFYRYSVDERWEIPHFEKMLYDNALLLPVYADMWRASGDEFYRRIARETAGWVLRDMRNPDGAFYSSLDADSEGEEGRYYVWTPQEVRATVDDEQYVVLERRFGLTDEANFEGAWHLAVRTETQDIADALDKTADEVRRALNAGRQRLLDTRGARVPPGLDDKTLTSWNALMIRGLAIAGRQLDDPALVAAATRAVDALRTGLWDGTHLMATAKDGQAHLDAYLDDYAFLLDALIELLGCRWRAIDLDFATALADTLLDAFEDSAQGGFFFTAHDHEALLTRLKPLADEATPSGNGVAALALQRLGFLLGETRYLDAAEATLRTGWEVMSRYPHAHTSLLKALSEHLAPPDIVILRGRPDMLDTWREAIGALYAPGRLVLSVPEDADGLPEAIAAKRPQGDVVAYLCRGTTCSPPMTELDALARALTSAGTDDA